MLSSSLKAALTGAVKSPIQWDAPLARLTTFRIGGPADALVTLLDQAELQAVLAICLQEGIPWKIMGKGSNILASDRGFTGLIMTLGGEFNQISRLDSASTQALPVRVGAGLSLPRFANWCAAEGAAGAEFSAGIPGSIGGGLVMNAGAWGQDMGSITASAELTNHAERRTISAPQLQFSYRSCTTIRPMLQKGWVITAVEFSLHRGDGQAIREKMRNLLSKRMETQPLGAATAGSVFKNPPGHSAGQLIEAAELKGFRLGDAEVSEKHANFIVNRGQATALEVHAVMKEIQERVAVTSGILLEPEIEMIGMG